MRSISIKNANLALLAIFFCAVVQAKQSDFSEPVYVDAITQTAELQDNRLTFNKDVTINQGTIRIKAEKVVVIRAGEKGSDVMTAYGKPATFFQILDNGKPVNAHGDTIRYELKKKLVTITGNAELKQDDSQINGDVIRYDIVKQKMVAEGNQQNSRVKSVFLPDQVQSFDKPAGEQGSTGKKE